MSFFIPSLRVFSLLGVGEISRLLTNFKISPVFRVCISHTRKVARPVLVWLALHNSGPNTLISFKQTGGDRLANQLQQILQLSRLFSEAATLFLLFQSYHEFANYLCREVFTDMSVLPLVFPSNISCFSRGSYKVRTTILAKRWVSNSCQLSQEELARKRELPVPPQPRRTGILARSDDNLAGEDTTELMWSHGALCGAEMIAMFSTCYNSIFPQSNTREIYYRNL